jgi:hypothetical protein
MMNHPVERRRGIISRQATPGQWSGGLIVPVSAFALDLAAIDRPEAHARTSIFLKWASGGVDH